MMASYPGRGGGRAGGDESSKSGGLVLRSGGETVDYIAIHCEKEGWK